MAVETASTQTKSTPSSVKKIIPIFKSITTKQMLGLFAWAPCFIQLTVDLGQLTATSTLKEEDWSNE